MTCANYVNILVALANSIADTWSSHIASTNLVPSTLQESGNETNTVHATCGLDLDELTPTFTSAFPTVNVINTNEVDVNYSGWYSQDPQPFWFFPGQKVLDPD